jgi:DNA-binding NarL/FixJ family response regulator
MTERDMSARRPPRILVVDDEPLNVDYLEQELEACGFAVESAASGLEALELIAADPPDLVLLDVMMPGLDGISVLRVLKEVPETRLIPVVLLTALHAVDDRVRGIEAGADDFLSKPVDDQELLARIRTALGLRRTIGETVGELRTARAQLERYGRLERDVAALAIEWRLRDASLPDGAVGFVGRLRRAKAEERIRALGGMPGEDDGGLLVAVFDGTDVHARATAAVDAALAVLDESSAGGEARMCVTAGVAVGRALVGSTRVRRAGESRWLFGAEGEPVDWASELARAATASGVFATSAAAAALGGRFELERTGGGALRVVARLSPEQRPRDRRVATILMTDVVGSTRTVERVGDRSWGELAAAHERATRVELALFGGEELDTAGDGFLMAFDSPARAIGCALAVRDRVAALGLRIRAGIHTGEVEQVGGRARGITLHVAARIAARANPGEVLVSSTTRELAAGAGLDFTDRGEHLLNGISEPRRLYAAVEARAEPPAPGPVRASGDGYPAGLTAREVDVLRLVAVGLTDAQAAGRLVVSVRTVNAHLRSVYRKLGVSSRAAAGRFAFENGLLGD